MVWWTHPNKSNDMDWFRLQSLPDTVHQTINIIYDCRSGSICNRYAYRILTNAGVNIFNVDLTRQDNEVELFERVKEAVIGCEAIDKECSPRIYRPIGLSVMVSVKEPYELDDRVDIIILKDITKTEELLEFRKRNKKFSSIPILAWPLNYRIEDLNELIKRSAGILLDKNFFSNEIRDFLCVIKAAKEALKPVFHVHSHMIQDYYDDKSQALERRILAYTKSIIEYGIDGVVFEGVGKPADILLHGVVGATELARLQIKDRKEYFRHSFQTYIPCLPPISAAFGASIAALNSEANAIIVFTTSGASARLVAKTLPPCHIIAITTHKSTARQLHLYKKVLPAYYEKNRAQSWHEECIARITFGTYFGFEIGLLDFSAKLVVLTPREQGIGYCNTFQIIRASNIIKVPGMISCEP